MARKFKFKLAPVLKFRERIEDDAKNRFAHITQIRNAKMDEIELLQQEQAAANESMAEHKVGVINTNALRHLNRYLSGLGVSERQRSGELRMIDREVEKRRTEFVVARQDVRVMEKLEERKLKEHEYEQGREETRIFDELALQRVRQQGLEEERREENLTRSQEA